MIDELGGSMKKQADQLAGAKKEIASQSAALVALKESWKLAETKRVEAAKKIPPAPKVSELESMLTKKPEPPPEKKVEPAKKIEIAKTPDPVPQPPAPMPSAKPVRFASDIKPIFDSKCVLCHGGKSTKGGLSLLTAAKTKAGGNVGTGFVPGKIEESTLLEYIGDNRMPPGNTKLTVAEKKQIREWILQGGN